MSAQLTDGGSQQETIHRRLELQPYNAQRLADLCGQFNQNLMQIEQRLGVQIRNRGNSFSIEGGPAQVRSAQHVLKELYAATDNGHLSPEQVHLHLQEASWEPTEEPADAANLSMLRTRRVLVKPRGANQKRYVKLIQSKDINFGIGPAGTGKTWLAVACAVAALEQDKVSRILLVRPAVEAGEKLGFLPGDLSQKIDPYLRPLYDALYEMLGFETVGKLIERNVIEVAPLAYMRGRTLNDSFIILDEAQNTTKAQMKMFLTRIGFGSTAVITGDLTQVDLPKDTYSGLKHAISVLRRIDGIGQVEFESKDVVRHQLVQRIVEAYERHETRSGSGKSSAQEYKR
ncbi:MAG: PhoH family protein [Pseudomonadota bacterium]